ncbi:DNA topoisomerase [Paraburkholderia sp. A1RI-2L]|uniref:DNA topoisomerase n=1 Tax=Paraburkholderia sp. A1RI-2L TaxID=3028367 RepID=UPI003B8121F1
MKKALLVVESPKKARTIQQILGEQDFEVIASVGHVCDLPADEVGVDTNSFELTYVLTQRGKEVLARIKSAASRSSEVILATDPDREGEAIAWHIANLLKLKNARRAMFNEITATALKKALQTSGKINDNLVNARQARRGTDRLIGYSVSKPLSNLLSRRGLSTGRVQSAAIALLVEQERLIRNHISRDHYTVTLSFGDESVWEARWIIPDDATETATLRGNALMNYERSAPICMDLEAASAAADVATVVVKQFVMRPGKRIPPPPLITSTMQQQAANRWGYDPEEAMTAAQSLFESGLISYHRTDNPNLSQEGSDAIRAFAVTQGLPVAVDRNKWPSPPGAQEGHEAIRPSNIEVEEAGENGAEKNLYRLIRLRAIQSQLAPAEYSVCEITLTDEAGKYEYRASARELVSEGFLKFATLSGAGEPDNPDEEQPEDTYIALPTLTNGMRLNVMDSEVKKHRTALPRRYTVASLMRKLEVLGIGRPSTYATTFATLSSRGYAEKSDKQLTPTTVCELIYDALYPTFSYSDLEYTRKMEESLDAVAGGRMRHVDLMRETWRTLNEELSSFGSGSLPRPDAPDTVPEPVKSCPKCGRLMRLGKGRFGEFWSCSGYFENKACTYTESVR